MLELSKVAFYGDVNLIPELIAKGGDVNEVDGAGNTPLHWAVMSGRIEGVRMLIANNANVNIQNKKGKAAIHLACFFNREEMVIDLVSAGSDLDLKDSDNQTPLSTAIRWRYHGIANLLGNSANLPLEKKETRRCYRP